ncbi:uncharacterized protein C8A04DRAFT_25329 [Dichotomopilus funicola]|uniref:Replication protein A 32 kDa subunit n=1 Tax=Dichotomopilus funicola TaxID=1934379 RepID=A0AAN6VAW5_9PEZI|nr:hypothetical protein C8A04DRAFT_25329 [Dichotomopilus funicola]
MASYGGYQQTGYGSQGGDNAGGFSLGSQPGGSQGGSGNNKRNFADDTLRPLTVKQIVDIKDRYPGGEIVIDGQAVTQLTLVGQVRSVNSQNTHILYHIDDGTGMMDIKRWVELSNQDNITRFAPDTYVRIYGNIQTYEGKRLVTAHYMRAIEDFNEVNYHLLEATYVHLSLTKGTAAGGGDQGGDSMDTSGDGLFVDNRGAGGDAALQQKLGPCSRNARTVFLYLSKQESEGTHLNQVAAGTKLTAGDIMAATDELLGHGLVYTTNDDETWAIMETYD